MVLEGPKKAVNDVVSSGARSEDARLGMREVLLCSRDQEPGF